MLRIVHGVGISILDNLIVFGAKSVYVDNSAGNSGAKILISSTRRVEIDWPPPHG